MGLLSFFDAGKALAFGATVVQEYLKIRALKDSSKKHTDRKSDRTVALVRRVSAYAREQKLNFYVRSKMLAQIKSGLIEGGVEAGEAGEFVSSVAVEALRR